jgi:hypothetical protein
MQKAVRKAAGDERVYIPGRGSDWQMRQAPMPYQDVAGGEGGHRATKPEGVIHWHIFGQTLTFLETYSTISRSNVSLVFTLPAATHKSATS